MKKKPVLFVCLLSLGLGLGGLVMPVGCGGVDSQEPKGETLTTDAGKTPDTVVTPDKAAPTDSAPLDTGTTPDKATTPDTTTVADSAPDTKTTPDTGTTQDTAPDAGTTGISYAKDIEAIFLKNNCTSSYCHGGGTKSGGFGFGTDGYANLVNAKSTSGAWTRVVPGDPAKSLLYEKLSKETPAEGGRMPQGGKMEQADLDTIRDWIQQGAKP